MVLSALRSFDFDGVHSKAWWCFALLCQTNFFHLSRSYFVFIQYIIQLNGVRHGDWGSEVCQKLLIFFMTALVQTIGGTLNLNFPSLDISVFHAEASILRDGPADLLRYLFALVALILFLRVNTALRCIPNKRQFLSWFIIVFYFTSRTWLLLLLCRYIN